MEIKSASEHLEEYLAEQRPAYAMYLRKSRADLELEALGEGETLAKHKAMLYALAAKRDIHPDQITVYEEIVSGESLDERTEAQRLLHDVFDKTYKGVLVVEVERLARGNTKDQGEVAEAFQYSSTLIITPAKVYDPNDEFDQEYFEFGLFMSRREYKTIRRRLDAGKLQAVKEGNYLLPTAPFGYDILKISKKERTLVENPEQARILRMIFDWYTEDRKPTSWIANQLTEMGIPTKKNRERWARQSIREMLFNAHYIGKVSWGHQEVYKVKDPKTGKIVKRRRQVAANMQLFEGKHEALISEEQFYKVREIYGKNAPAKMNTDLTNPFAGLLFCCDCGRSLIFHDYHDDSRLPRYNHPYRYKCQKKSVNSTVMTKAIIAALKAKIADFEIQMDTYTQEDEIKRHQDNLEAMENELKKQQQKKRRLFDSWEADDGVYTKEEFIERKQMYAHTIEKLETQIKDFKANAPKPVNYEEEKATIHALIETIQNPEIGAKEKNDFLKKYIIKIDYDAIDLGRNKGAKPILDLHLR